MSPVPARPGALGQVDRRRLTALMGAGLLDSLCLSMAWTVVVLWVAEEHGLAAVGVCSAAMLVGVALSAPVAGRVAARLDGRRLLGTVTVVELGLRLTLAVLVLAQAPLPLLVVCVGVMNISAWTGYAAMRAEVTAVRPGPAALTWYGTGVAAVEAGGVALAAFLTVDPAARQGVLVALMVTNVLGLLPTLLVARASRVPRGAAAVEGRRGRLSYLPVAGGLLMLVGSAPTLLYVALSEEAHGRTAVAAAAVSFVVGSLVAGTVASSVLRRLGSSSTLYCLVAAGMVLGWVVAPVSVPLLCVAQLMSGVCMTLLEGLLDNAAASREPDRVTGALASVTAGRALGSAAGTAALPLLVAQTGLSSAAAVATCVLVAAGVAAAGWDRRRRRRGPAVPRPRTAPTGTSSTGGAERGGALVPTSGTGPSAGP